MSRRSAWALLIAANALCYCVLSFYQSSAAAPPKPRLPFANSVEQRFDTLAELREIKKLLKEQNELLSNGKLRVVIDSP
ncbi:MAG: hypothetical protein ACOC46_01755 [Pirellulales bacterium]